jgi:hypothetical protein
MSDVVEIIISGNDAGPIQIIEADQFNHNSLPDLQGGTGGQYYHLTSGQYSFVTGIFADQIDPTHDVFFEKNVSVSGTLLLGSGTDNSLSGIRTAADGSFSQAGDAQYSEFILKRETTTTGVYELSFPNQIKKLTLPNNTSWFFKVRVIGRSTAGLTSTFNAEGTIKKGISAGFTEIVGGTIVNGVTDELAVGGMLIDADTTYGYLKISVLGLVATTIHWVAFLDLIQVK